MNSSKLLSRSSNIATTYNDRVIETKRHFIGLMTSYSSLNHRVRLVCPKVLIGVF